MTLNQLESLTDDELAMCLYIVNVVFPSTIPKVEFNAQNLTWFKHDMLVKKLLNAFPRILPEGHPIFTSLMSKLGVKVDIKLDPPPIIQSPDSGSVPNSGSI